MKQTDLNKQTAQQAAGVVISAGAGVIGASVVRRSDAGFERICQAEYDLADGLDNAVRRVLEMGGDRQMPVVIGLDSAQLRYIELSLPPAEASRLSGLIRMQAESRLPLDGDRMQLAWRLSPSAQGYACTVAAARLDAGDAAMNKLSLNGQLSAIVPEAAGFAQLRQRFFEATPEACIVLRRRSDGFAVIWLDGAELLRSAVVHAEPSDLAERAGLVMQDIQAELEQFTKTQEHSIPVYVCPDEDAFMERIVEHLSGAGWKVDWLKADQAALKQANLDEDRGRDALLLDAAGLALMGLGQATPAFDFLQTRQLAQSAQSVAVQRKKRIRTVVALVVLALLCGAVGYWSLLLEVRQLRRELAVEVEGATAESVLQQQAYQEAITRARVDMLELLGVIQGSRDGMLLDSIEFEIGKPVKLVATAGGYEQVYGFQKRLEDQDGVGQVRLIDPRLDERTRQVRFTLQFDYKHYTR